MSKPRVAIFDFACCEGCQLQIVNLEEEILELIGAVDVVEWREAMSEQSREYDIAIVEGSITRPEDEERLWVIRSRVKMLIALGACATIGGINKLKNNFDLQDVKKCVYGKNANMPHLDTTMTRAIDEVVKVDYKIHGCPIDRKEFTYIMRSPADGQNTGNTGMACLRRVQGKGQSVPVGIRPGLPRPDYPRRLRSKMPLIRIQMFRLSRLY